MKREAHTPADWAATEPGWQELRQQLSRLRRRALARPGRVALVTLLAAGAVVLRQGIRRETFDASITFRVAEQTRDPGEGDYQTKGRLREYLADGILTKQRCLALIERLKLYPKLYAVDPNRALDEFRDDLQIKVLMNYFLKEDWQDTGKPRSARVVLSFTYTDPETALHTARTIGELVHEQEAAARRQLARVAAAQTQAMADALRTKIEGLRAQQAQRLVELAAEAGDDHLKFELLGQQIRGLRARVAEEPANLSAARQLKSALDEQRRLRAALGTTSESMRLASLRVDLERINNEIERLDQTLDQAESEQTAQELRAALERHELLLRFEVVDWGRASTPLLSRPWRLAILGLAMFIVLWPLIGVGVAAFDPRIHDLDDVRHLKLTPLGHVPPFPGDAVGAVGERVARWAARRGGASPCRGGGPQP